MSLLKTARQVMNFCRNPPKLVDYLYAELSALDQRVVDVEAGNVAEGSIGTDELADDAVDSSKISLFVSTEQSGDGNVQSIAHGLGVEPTTVLVIFSNVGADGATYTFTKGTANVNVTATSGAKYFVVAIA